MQETQETQVQSPGREDPLEEEMATHSSILASRIPWAEKPDGLQPMGLQRVGHGWAGTHTQMWNYIIWQCVTFRNWLFSLSITLWRFIQIVTSINSSLLFMWVVFHIIICLKLTRWRIAGSFPVFGRFGVNISFHFSEKNSC